MSPVRAVVVMLVACALGCRAELDGLRCKAFTGAMKNVGEVLYCYTHESLQIHRENRNSLQSLSDMLQLVKEQITLEMERNMGSMKKELAGLNKEAENTQEIQDLKSRLEGKDEKVTTLTQEIQDLRAQLEARSHTVDTCIQENQSTKQKYEEERTKISTVTNENHDLRRQLAAKDEKVQDLNNRLQESVQRVVELESTVMKLNQTCKKEEVDEDPECRQPQLQEIQDVVQRFNSSKDLKQLGADLESTLDSSSVEYQQLQSVERSDQFPFRLGQSGNIQLVTLLLCAGLPVDTAGYNNGRTLLLGAAGECHVQLVRFLLQHGAQVNAQDVWQYTPLIMAAHMGHLEVVKVLVEAGANTTARNQFGRTALEAARDNIHLAIVHYLQPLPH